MMQPRRAAHDDHFHVRIACPRDQHPTCVEQPVMYAPHTRPPVIRERHRSGTDERRKPLPVLPMPPKGVGSIARSGEPAEDLDIQNAMETTPESGRPSERSAEPLANAGETDNVSP
jgi:hypothetical protein